MLFDFLSLVEQGAVYLRPFFRFSVFIAPPGDGKWGHFFAGQHLPPQEVANAALHVLEQHVSLPVADLVRETARLLGYQRTGPTVEKSIRGGIGLLVRKGGAKEESGMIVHR